MKSSGGSSRRSGLFHRDRYGFFGAAFGSSGFFASSGFATVSPNVILTSPYVRARQTARSAGDRDHGGDARRGDDRGEHLAHGAHAFEPSPAPRGTDFGARRVVAGVGDHIVPLW